MDTPANLKQRITAFAYDFMLLFIYLALLAAVFLLLSLGPLKSQIAWLTSTPPKMNLLAFFTTVLPFTLYFSLQESSSAGATWGKRKAGVQVANLQGKRLSFNRALLRSIMKFLPWQIAHTCIFSLPYDRTAPWWLIAGLILVQIWVVFYLLVLWLNRTHRTPYDWIAGSMVILKIKNLSRS
jgi:uncharacterized RDD family membrane protein YckC